MAHENPSPGETMQRAGLGAGLAIGMGTGVATGVALDNMGVGIALGVSIGIALMAGFTAAAAKMRRDEQSTRPGADADETERSDGADDR